MLIVNVRPLNAPLYFERRPSGSGSRSGLTPRHHSAPADEVDDLDFVALLNDCAVEGGTFDDHQVQLDGDAARVHGQAGQQRRDCQRRRHLVTLAVERDGHSGEGSTGWSAECRVPSAVSREP
jgi:hypothetical protein